MKNFLKGKLNIKFLSSLTVGILVVFLASTHTTHAFPGFSLDDITGGFVSTLSFFVSYVISGILGVVVAVEAWLIEVVLNMNDVVFQTTFVQTGFSIALSIANLAFVLGIIVIAIATIIRNENYGIKKLLWKLVVAAVLVNFGLVIAAPIFGLGNSFSHYFLNCIRPTSGGCTQSSSGLSSYDSFATTFAGAFQPEDNFTTLTKATTGSTGQTQSISKVQGAFSALGTDFGKTAVPVAGMFFVLINLVLVVVVLAGFFILMLIRFIYIAILAILMPFAWASWVFPIFGNHWKKWWDKFLQWTFFAPIALFFIYLAMLLMQISKGTTGSVSGLAFAQYTSGATSPIYKAISGFFTAMFTPILSALMQEIVFASLIVGGLFAANSMGIKGSKAVTGAATGAGKAAGVWAGKRTLRGGMNAASRMTAPKEQRSKDGGTYVENTRWNRLRGRISTKFQEGAEHKSLETKGMMTSVLEGAKEGSGLFKKKKKGGHSDDHGGGGGGSGGGGGARRSGSGGGQGAGGGRGGAAHAPASGGGHGAHAQTTTQQDAAAQLDALGFGGGSSTAAEPTAPKATTPQNKAAANTEIAALNNSSEKSTASAQFDKMEQNARQSRPNNVINIDSSQNFGNNIPKPPTPNSGDNVREMPRRQA